MAFRAAEYSALDTAFGNDSRGVREQSGQNYPGYSNKRLDKVLDDVETICEPKANTALWKELQTIYSSELPVLPLYFRATPLFCLSG